MAYKHFLDARIDFFPFLDILFPKIKFFDGLYKHFLEAEFKIFPKKEKFDSLYKHFLRAIIGFFSFFGYIISFLEKV